MDRKACEITKFLLDWNTLLTNVPVDGSITEIYFCFIFSNYSKGKDRVSWQQFIKYLRLLNNIGNGHVLECRPENALDLMYEDPFKCFNKITYINRLALIIIAKEERALSKKEPRLLDEKDMEVKKPKEKGAIPNEKGEQLKMLMDLVEGPDYTPKRRWNVIETLPEKILHTSKLTLSESDSIYSITSRSGRLQQMEILLKSECASHQLMRERSRLLTRVQPFYDCCEIADHATQLSQLVDFNRATNYCKLKSNANISSGSPIGKCINEKMHFIPIIQPQTDIRLGDCSYLDTCHKMNTCRYVHYGLLMPEAPPDSETRRKVADHVSSKALRTGLYTRGQAINASAMENTPPQWIRCDVTKLDLNVLGSNWGIVLADPSWTIHMNLNYSSMKDDDLLSLRMDKLQVEGLYLLWVTGRTIEMGKDFLKKWGYRVVNQITWVKTSQLVRTISTGRTGHWLNHSKEHLLVGLKGNPKWLNPGMDPQILVSSTRETSRKPDEIYGIIERLAGSGVKKLEIFGRQHNTRPGWLTIGNQLEETHLVEKELLVRYNRWTEEHPGDSLNSVRVSSQ
ncbi:DEBR0S2_17568g1_1 [Brettanomyces bruxellensis]|uniref:mRNA m(6)A methyltransferase n=1 Tax=Dekkera bruxellensis TaxID=5007 RepID=A0A7D9GZB0_DEKBR|nr:DEBR0S2_17568g1_1 [Brettanomyces bruxellensis]